MKKRHKRRDPIAEMAREEHEFRESLRQRKAKLRRGQPSRDSIPRSIRAHRSADKRGNG